MGTITVDKKLLDSYVTIFERLDEKAREYVLRKLNKPEKSKKTSHEEFMKLAGSWEDERSSDEIIQDIKESRINQPKRDIF